MGILHRSYISLRVHLRVARIRWPTRFISVGKRHPRHHRGDRSYVLLTLPHRLNCFWSHSSTKKKKIVPPFRGENRTAPRGAYVHFRSTDAARAGFRVLKGREGPAGSEALHVTMSRKSALRADLLWRWAYIEASGEGDAYFEELWNGLGFGTGRESSSAARRVESGSGKQAEPGTRGGRLKVWKDPAWNREKRDAEDTTFSHPLWTDAGDGGEGEGEKDPRFFLRAEVEREVEEGQQVARTAFLHRRQSRRGPPTTGDP